MKITRCPRTSRIIKTLISNNNGDYEKYCIEIKSKLKSKISGFDDVIDNIRCNSELLYDIDIITESKYYVPIHTRDIIIKHLKRYSERTKEHESIRDLLYRVLCISLTVEFDKNSL